MNSETAEGLSKCYGGLGFPFRGSRGERGEEEAGKKNKGNRGRKAKGKRRIMNNEYRIMNNE